MSGRTSQTAADGLLRSVVADALASILIVLAILLLVFGGAALAQPKLTYAAGKVVGLSNLSTDEGCLPAKLTGRVVKRAFGRDGLYLESVILEEKSGQRTFINVEDGYRTLDAATNGAVKQSLETMLSAGKTVSVRVLGCGAAARTLTLDAVRPL
ncbi:MULTISPECIES: hypothetical protein [Methylobacteriaceae]|uniref:hypothetical protein n=1 Tax=Methylobacteriaceae TaxID=119045 RepID=UPI00074F920C|nr:MULTISPECIES: hypothetical protein [Methylobacteriaceae]AMB43533.1 hypothetical protein Y590_01375 [Methylobacterium sp. AMS5]TFZ58858.1 hypothetical protein E4V01_09810 [Methylorubrum sp. Q1]